MDRLINGINQVIINPLIILLFALALLLFLWGVFVFIANAEDETKRKEGAQHMFWGIIGLSIMVGAWGILRFVDSSIDEVNDTGENTLLDVYEDDGGFNFGEEE